MVKVISSGFYTTIQDLGRFGFQEYGVPISGAMDKHSANIANALLGNNENAAVLEITMTGPSLQFNKDTCICISGGDMNPKLNDSTVKINHLIVIKSGDVLSFGKLNYGFITYLAVSGGFQTEMIMASRSMYSGITSQFKINNGDELQLFEGLSLVKRSNSGIKLNRQHFVSKKIEVYKGPEFYQLSKLQQARLFEPQTLSKDSNRMASQLQNSIPNNLKPIITSLVLSGTVQLTPHGRLIVLMRDCQTTGGYPRVLQLKESSIDVLAQKNTGNKIKFVMMEG